MKVTIALIALAVAVHGQSIPSCAEACFLKAIQASGCSLTDYYCQCTTGAKAIGQSVVPCLCTSTCSKAELAAVQKDSDTICSSALAASGMTYTPAALPTNACAAASTGTTAAATTSAATTGTTSSAAMSSSSPMTSSSSATTSTSASVASGNYAPAPTHMGVQGVMLGVAGLAMAAL